MGRFRFGGRLRGLKSKLLINKMHIRYKMGRFRLGSRFLYLSHNKLYRVTYNQK